MSRAAKKEVGWEMGWEVATRGDQGMGKQARRTRHREGSKESKAAEKEVGRAR